MASFVPYPNNNVHAADPGLEVAEPQKEHYIDPASAPLYGDHEREPHYAEQSPGFQRSKTICGLTRTTFWLALALVLVIVIAAVGGGVGGSIAVHDASKTRKTSATTVTVSSAPTSTSSSTNLTNLVVPLPNDVATVALDCPTSGTNSYTSGASITFSWQCGTDYNAGSENEAKNGTIVDLTSLIAYSIEDCMEACSQMNALDVITCAGVTFRSEMKHYYATARANCWLKDSTGPGSSGQGNIVAVAKIVS
ncbi:MAG: hypothetical protein M1827_002928 [Pycnora praestabilis]|nr:MAG: hypothetical protein M1827_002928 [Pycnora praestabilis]